MKLLHNIGTIKHSNYNTREQVLACNEPLGFDGIYLNVYENRDILEGKDVYLFVMGNYIGKDNTFDLPNVPKLEKYCSMEQLYELWKSGCKLGWHTWSHPDLTTLSREEIMKEITPMNKMFGEYFAYPYGRYNDLVVQCVKEAGYKEVWSVTQGNDGQFTKLRTYL